MLAWITTVTRQWDLRMQPATSHVQKYREVSRVLVVTLALNWLVATGKLVVGHSSASLAMVADGFHSLLDGSSNIVGLIAIYFAYKPADDDHQYGHRKYETVSAMGISVALFAAAWHILSDAVHRLSNPVVPEVGMLSIAVMLVTIGVNLGVSRYERREGTRLGSQFLISDAAHTGSDVYASLSVLGALFAARLGWDWLDLIASVFISAVIVRTGYGIVRSGLSVISDQIALDPKVIQAIVSEIPTVRGCERIRSRGTDDHIFLDLVCRVPGTMTMNDAHELADHIEALIHQRLPAVKDIVVHLEPSVE